MLKRKKYSENEVTCPKVVRIISGRFQLKMLDPLYYLDFLFPTQNIKDSLVSHREEKQNHFFFSAAPAACKNFQARDGIHATAVTRATAVTMLDP